MTEETINEETNFVEQYPQEAAKQQPKAKRDIFYFNGDIPTAINLEYVTRISVEEKKITFFFYSDAIYINMESSEAAQNLFKVLLKAWSADVLE